MHKEHLVFIEPNDSDILWRYLDFTKSIDLLESQSIFFTRADKFEGSYSKLNRRIGREVYKDMTDDQYDNMVKQISLLSKNMIRYTLMDTIPVLMYELVEILITNVLLPRPIGSKYRSIRAVI
ncbi:hypothetical protein ACSW9K_08320 [Clostridium perfringens]